MTIETEESVALRGSSDGHSSARWCPLCRRQVESITPQQAARIGHVSERAMYAWIEAGKVHFTETAEGLLLVCLDSLTRLKAGVDR